MSDVKETKLAAQQQQQEEEKEKAKVSKEVSKEEEEEEEDASEEETDAAGGEGGGKKKKKNKKKKKKKKGSSASGVGKYVTQTAQSLAGFAPNRPGGGRRSREKTPSAQRGPHVDARQRLPFWRNFRAKTAVRRAMH